MLKAKAEARRALEDVIFDLTDEEAENNTPKKTKAGEEADEWLREEFENLSVADINGKYRELRKLVNA